MKHTGFPRARRIPVADEEPLIGSDRYDYADAFEIRVRESDARSAEQFARFALEQAPRVVRWIIWIAHRYVIRFRLAPRSSPNHVMGWTILRSEPDVIHLKAVSALARAELLGRRVDPTCTSITTYVFYTRPVAARILLKLVGPVHRRIAPYLLERAAAAADQDDPLTAVSKERVL